MIIQRSLTELSVPYGARPVNFGLGVRQGFRNRFRFHALLPQFGGQASVSIAHRTGSHTPRGVPFVAQVPLLFEVGNDIRHIVRRLVLREGMREFAVKLIPTVFAACESIQTPRHQAAGLFLAPVLTESHS